MPSAVSFSFSSVSMPTNWLKTSTRWPPSMTSSSSSPNISSLPEALAGIDVVQLQQPQIAAHLAQPQQRGEHHHAALGHALRADGFQHFLAARFDHLLINAALVGRQFAEGDLLELGRQIGRHFLLQPAQHERPQPPRQPRLGLRVSSPARWAIRSARGNPSPCPGSPA